MANEIEVFHFEEGRPSFETYGHDNGFRHWLASEIMALLDYNSMQPILRAVNRAMAACAQLEISIPENFQQTEMKRRDWKLSRFACYLTVMNADPKKPRVAEAQAYFVTIAEAFRQYLQEAEAVERVVIRGEVSDREKTISATVHNRGIENLRIVSERRISWYVQHASVAGKEAKGRSGWVDRHSTLWGRPSWRRTSFGSPRLRKRFGTKISSDSDLSNARQSRSAEQYGIR